MHLSRVHRSMLFIMLCAATVVLTGCNGEGNIAVNKAQRGGLWGMKLTSTAFENGGAIAKKYTADGENVSPPLHWNNGPNGTVEYAIIVEDPATGKTPATHWLLYRLPATVHDLPENAAATMKLTQGANYMGQNAYAGPKLKKGETHKYYFQIFALNAPLKAEPGATREILAKAYDGFVLSKGVTMAWYKSE